MENGSNEHEDQETSPHMIRHHCKVCNKGFGCAGALGGHMRAHVMGGGTTGEGGGDHNFNSILDENMATTTNKSESSNKHSYFLRAKTPRFYQAGGDHDNLQEYKNSASPLSSRLPPLFPGSRQESSTSREEEDLANCLVMLSNKSCHNNKEENKAKEVVERGLFQCKACKKVFTSHQALGGHRASHKKVKGCFAAKVDDHGLHDDDNVDEDLIQEDQDRVTPPESDTTRLAITPTRKRPYKMHECSVCRRVFTSGQALGGHKRCHWLTTSTDNAFIPNFHDFQYGHQNQRQQQQQQFYKNPVLKTINPNQHEKSNDAQIDLNLNLHVPQIDNTSSYESPKKTLYLQQLKSDAGGKINESENEERGCEVKLRKLSDLRDVNLDGGWLQMGIASTND